MQVDTSHPVFRHFVLLMCRHLMKLYHRHRLLEWRVKMERTSNEAIVTYIKVLNIHSSGRFALRKTYQDITSCHRIKNSVGQYKNYGKVECDGTRCSWLRHCATIRKVAGSIPDWVIWDFSVT
jgi:hypothetical protein